MTTMVEIAFSSYYVTKDKRVIGGSEVGVLAIPPEDIVEKGRLMPGKMFLLDFKQVPNPHPSILNPQPSTLNRAPFTHCLRALERNLGHGKA